MRFSDDRGSVAVIAALTISVVVAGAAFGVEMGYYNYDQVRLQQAADAAAYAAAIELRNGSDPSTAEAAGLAAAQQNTFNAASDSLAMVTPVPGASTTNSVRVTLSRNEVRSFSALFTSAPMVVQAASSAAFTSAASACVLALDPAAGNAANFAGNTNVNLVGCSVMANSIAPNAINVQGSARLTVPCLYTVGDVSLTSGANLTDCPAAETGLPPVADPYAGLVYPAVTGPCLSTGGGTLSPGRYCGGLSLSGSKTLSAGVYVIDGGVFRINANADVFGAGVTIFLMNGASLSFNGNSHVQLAAPTSGTYSGMLFVGGRGNTVANTVNGDNSSLLTGAIYFPSSDVSYLGNFSGSGGCTQIVARTVSWSGSTTVRVDCSMYGMTPVSAVNAVRLIG